MEHILTLRQIEGFREYLREEERSISTIEKYLHDVRAFYSWVNNRAVTKELVTQWKEQLIARSFAAVTINAALAALHSFFCYAEWKECKVKYLKVQRKIFRDASKELTRGEYSRLVEAAVKRGDERLALVMETICGTGIRVSEIKYITVEAVSQGKACISLKGKYRTILIPGKLAKKLKKYAKKQKIASGEIFLAAGGGSLSRRQIWYEMKQLCRTTGVDASKVFPHERVIIRTS